MVQNLVEKGVKKMARKKKWIQRAIKRPGALRRKAKAAGKSVREYCRTLPKNASTRTKRQCALALRLMSYAKRRKRRG